MCVKVRVMVRVIRVRVRVIRVRVRVGSERRGDPHTASIPFTNTTHTPRRSAIGGMTQMPLGAPIAHGTRLNSMSHRNGQSTRPARIGSMMRAT